MQLRTKLDNKFKIFSNKDVIPYEEITKIFSSDEIKKSDLNVYLNYYENIAVAYYYNVASGDLLFDLFGQGFVKTKQKFMDYIKQERINRNNNRLWKYFEKLGNEWESKLIENYEVNVSKQGNKKIFLALFCILIIIIFATLFFYFQTNEMKFLAQIVIFFAIAIISNIFYEYLKEILGI